MNIDYNVVQLRNAQMYILKEIDRICKKYDIKYFLDCGSMLGAVRHKGFIPWDDDLDVGMMDIDYQRFVKVARSELRTDFFLDNYNTNPDNALVFSKLRLLGTEYIENKGNKDALHNEVFVDVFPYYYVSDNPIIRKIEGYIMAFISQAIMSKHGYKVWKGEKLSKRFKFIPSDIVATIFPEKVLRHIVDVFYHKHDNTQNVCIHAGSAYDYWFFPKQYIQEMICVEFEGESYPIPKEYDKYLRTIYGDYMKLPPESKRVTHQIRKLDLGKYETIFK